MLQQGGGARVSLFGCGARIGIFFPLTHRNTLPVEQLDGLP